MKTIQYSAKQKACQEVVKFFIGGSVKYGPNRHIPHAPRPTQPKWRPLPPQDPARGRRIILAIGDANTSTNVRGTPPSSMKGFLAALNMVSKRMGVFTAQDTTDRQLIGQKKLVYFMVPEHKTSQVFSILMQLIQIDCLLYVSS